MEMNATTSANQPPPTLKPNTVTFRTADDTWYSENEEELLHVWHMIEDFIKNKGVVMLNKCRFNHFCAFVMSMTTTSRDSCI